MTTRLRDRVASTIRGVGSVVWLGFAVGATYVGLIVLTVTGDLLTDPGGWLGLGLAVGWLLPVLCLLVLALLRPAVAVPVLAVLTLFPVGFGVWSFLDYDGVRIWEDDRGPISLVLLVTVAAGLVVLGLNRPTEAGVLLLVATVVPGVLAIAGSGADWPRALSISLVTLPLGAAGVLYAAPGARKSDPSSR